MKRVIYTAITNGYECLKNPKCITPDVDYICFTDEDIKSPIWQIRKIKSKEHKDVKILPHKYLSEYDQSLWVDGSVCIRKDLSLFFEYQSSIIMFIHPKRRTIIEEVEICQQKKKAGFFILEKQKKRYKDITFPLLACGFILRRHNSKKIKSVMNSWYEEIKNYTSRDQISFPYVAQMHDLSVDVINEDIFENKWFLVYKVHRK